MTDLPKFFIRELGGTSEMFLAWLNISKLSEFSLLVSRQSWVYKLVSNKLTNPGLCWENKKYYIFG